MRELWRVYQYACRQCGQFLAEPRIPSGVSVDEYRPTQCYRCGSNDISEREKV